MRNLSLLSLYNGRKRSLSFGCPLIDEITGGVSRGIVTELCGEAGSGKTQICLKLALQAQLPLEDGGLCGNAAYISCGEGEFPITRLNQLAERCEVSSGIPKRDLLNGVLIEKAHNTEDLLESLSKQLPKMCTENNIKLVIIDSIAGIVRTEYNPQESDDMIIRSEIYFQLSQSLKWLSHTYSLCVVVVNQVTSTMEDRNYISSLPSSHSTSYLQHCYQEIDEGEYGGDTNAAASVRNHGGVLPALGLAWAHCVNTRIMLYRDTTVMRSLVSENSADEGDSIQLMLDSIFLEGNQDVSSSSIRRLILQSSPHLPSRECQFTISASGVFGL